MFGHDDQNNHDDNSQITLPTAGGFGQNDNDDTQDVPSIPEPAIAEHSAPDVLPHRKDEKSGAPTDDLLDIKQDALHALTPLIDHLEQSPIEKFRTTMMMIQASDNHGLIKMAYEAAQKIENDKERAQALLDIVNEINYFTQQNQA